jgi:hypothetical protein
MLNQDECHATVHRHGGKKRSKGVEAAGGRTDADDQPAVALLTWLGTRSAHSLIAVFDGNVSAPWTLTLPRSRRLLINAALD